jgi:hypothetical protein
MKIVIGDRLVLYASWLKPRRRPLFDVRPEPQWLIRNRQEQLRRQQLRARVRRWFLDARHWWLGIALGLIGGLLLMWLLRLIP